MMLLAPILQQKPPITDHFRPEADGWDANALTDGCPNDSALACLSREDVAIFVGKECCVRLFKPLKRLSSLLFLRCYAAVKTYYAAVIAA